MTANIRGVTKEIKKTRLGEIPEGWDTEAIADLPIDIIDGDRGKNYPPKSEFSRQGFCLFLNTKNVPGEHFDFTECDFINEERDQILRKGKLQKGDIVITTRGTVGNIAYYHERIPYGHIRINSGMVIVRNAGEKFDTDYLYHLLKSPRVKQQYLSFATGSAQPQLPIRDINKIKLTIPSILEQRSIAKIISDLEEKIELNHQMNKTLESIAQAIFKRWFVEGKDSVGHIAVGDLVEFDPRILVKKGDNLPYVEMKELSTAGMTVGSVAIKPFSGGAKFQNGDTLLARITPCLENGKTAFVSFLTDEQPIGFGSTEFIVMRPKERISPQFVYCLARDPEFRSFAIKSMVGSSGRQRVQRNMLKSYEIFKPGQNIMDKFYRATLPLFSLIRKNWKETKKLTQIRDSLLPKLMSGKIRIYG